MLRQVKKSIFSCANISKVEHLQKRVFIFSLQHFGCNIDDPWMMEYEQNFFRFSCRRAKCHQVFSIITTGSVPVLLFQRGYFRSQTSLDQLRIAPVVVFHCFSENNFRRIDHFVITEEQGIYSSGGTSSYWDLLLYLVEKYTNRETAVLASKFSVIDIDRSSQSAFMMFQGQKRKRSNVRRGLYRHKSIPRCF